MDFIFPGLRFQWFSKIKREQTILIPVLRAFIKLSAVLQQNIKTKNYLATVVFYFNFKEMFFSLDK